MAISRVRIERGRFEYLVCIKYIISPPEFVWPFLAPYVGDKKESMPAVRRVSR